MSNKAQSATAWKQAMKLSSADARVESLAQVISTWKDPAAAKAAISVSKLDAKTKQALRATIPAQ